MFGDPYFSRCVYCDVDCSLPEPDHDPSCPFETNVWPVTAETLGERGPGDPYSRGMRCSDCGSCFEVGDSYSYREVDETNWLVEPICLGCAAHELAMARP